MNENHRVPEFGSLVAGQAYASRPGAYALLFREGRVAVLETPRGGFLPGGGIEGAETPEEALRREVREECGWELTRLTRVGEAVEYVYTPGHQTGIRKECVFFTAAVAAAGGLPTEPDHVLVWLTPAEAEAKLAHGSQKWAVRHSLKSAVLRG